MSSYTVQLNSIFTREVIKSFSSGFICILGSMKSICNVDRVAEIPSQNNSITNQSLFNFEDGTYYWNVTCMDNASNFNTSLTRNFTVDTIKPEIYLTTPLNNTWSNTTDMDFSFIANDTNLEHCELWADFDGTWVWKADILDMNNYIEYSKGWTVNEGHYLWNIICYDFTGNWKINKTNNTIHIDTSEPNIRLIDPIPENYTVNTRVNLTWNTTDNMDVNTLCNVTINENTYDLNIPSPNATYANFSIDLVDDGQYFWNVTCRDNATNWNTSQTWNFTIDTILPNVSLDLPLNNSWWSTDDIDFYFTPHDENIDYCVLYGDFDGPFVAYNTINGVTTDVQETTSRTLKNGTYEWNVLCVDHAGNENFNETNRVVNVDTVIPNITLDWPPDEHPTSEDFINFSWNVTDNMAEYLMCNLTINDKVNKSFVPSQSNNITNISVIDFRDDTYYWNVTCIDNASNWNTSLTRNFTINSGVPGVVLKSPKNNTWNNTQFVQFKYEVYGMFIDNCSLIFNSSDGWKVNQTHDEPEVGGTVNMFSVEMVNDTFEWNVVCNNTAGTNGWGDESRTLHVDFCNPIDIVHT